ncbi:MAG: sensor histidine kinase [Acidobacteria bacterium]|nr:sensor histidine kinase [Acidobacteriota bacterium]
MQDVAPAQTPNAPAGAREVGDGDVRGGDVRGAAGVVRALHRRLLPPRERLGWLPYLWLFWLLNFFQKWFVVPIEPVEFGLTLGTVPLFLALYFNGYWHTGRRLLANVAGLLAIGIAWMPFNAGATTFFIYGSAFVGSAVRPPCAWGYLAGVALLLLVESLLLDLPAVFLLFGPPVCALVGAATVHLAEAGRQESALKLSQAEVRRLATVAERERIARDLHDLLGHTLSVIAIKAELAAKLAARGDRRAEREIRDVETVSRDALRQVREAVAGFRRVDLVGELASARLACEARDIGLAVDRPPLDLGPDPEAVLAMCLREAITNVVRHSDARHCRVSLAREGSMIRLTVADDGAGGAIREGAGLSGMRERVRRAGGEMRIESANGVALSVRVPSDAGPQGPEMRAPGREAA